MKYTKENIIEGINAKLDEIVAKNPDLTGICNVYRASLPNYPIEIEQNMLEWINDLPLTEIDCHGASIKGVMESRKLPDHFFPALVRNFITYKKYNFACGTYICYEGFRT